MGIPDIYRNDLQRRQRKLAEYDIERRELAIEQMNAIASANPGIVFGDCIYLNEYNIKSIRIVREFEQSGSHVKMTRCGVRIDYQDGESKFKEASKSEVRTVFRRAVTEYTCLVELPRPSEEGFEHVLSVAQDKGIDIKIPEDPDLPSSHH